MQPYYSLYHASQPCLCIIFSLFLSISSSNAYCTVLYSQFTSLLKRKKEKNNFVSFLHVANSLVIPGARYMPIVLCTGGGRTLFEHCRRSGAATACPASPDAAPRAPGRRGRLDGRSRGQSSVDVHAERAANHQIERGEGGDHHHQRHHQRPKMSSSATGGPGVWILIARCRPYVYR